MAQHRFRKPKTIIFTLLLLALALAIARQAAVTVTAAGGHRHTYTCAPSNTCSDRHAPAGRGDCDTVAA